MYFAEKMGPNWTWIAVYEGGGESDRYGGFSEFEQLQRAVLSNYRAYLQHKQEG